MLATVNNPKQYSDAQIYKQRCGLLEVTYAMEERGISIHRGRLEDMKSRYEGEVKNLNERCLAAADGTIKKLPKGGSSGDLKKVFFDHFKLESPYRTKKKKEAATDKRALEYWSIHLDKSSKAYEFITCLQAKRKRDTAITYMTNYQIAGKMPPPNATVWRNLKWRRDYIHIHPSFNICGTNTTRLSCNDPNAQNISKQEDFNNRFIFGPLPGRTWFSMDFENIEVRIPGFEMGEDSLVKLFNEGRSYHFLVASILHPKLWAECVKNGWDFKKKYKSTWYQWVKNGNFAIQYGAQKAKVDSTFRVDGAYEILRSSFPKITELGDYMVDHAREHGYVRCIGGYPLYCPRNEEGQIEPTTPLNYHVQGTAGWCMVLAMNRVYTYLRQYPDHHIIMTIHDELVFDFPENHPDNMKILYNIKLLMEMSGEDIDVPVPVKVSHHPYTWDKEVDVEFITAM